MDIGGRTWQLNDDKDKVFVQVADLYEEPKNTVKIVHDDVLTLVYSKEQFKIKDGDVSILKCETCLASLVDI